MTPEGDIFSVVFEDGPGSRRPPPESETSG